MSRKWQTVRVFISSTFQDMHAERDHLVKRVFPLLRERLLAYRIHLVDVDLRWGITKEEADNDRVLDLCLQQIDGCRPFFVGILGERYGWVPDHLPAIERPEYGWIQALVGKSVTELEIIHGVLRNPGMRGHAYFYFRDPDFGAYLPGDLRPIYIDEDEKAEKLAALKKEILDSRFPVMNSYPAQWDAVANRITDLDEFGDRILSDLWHGIKSEHELPDEPPTHGEDPLAEERHFHDQFIESRTRIYIGRHLTQAALWRFADCDGVVPCLVIGPSGSGKSAAIAKFVRDYSEQHPHVFVVSHFVGASPHSTGLRETLTRFCQELKGEFGIEDPIPQDTSHLVKAFREFLGTVPSNRRLLLVIDALNQLDEFDNAHKLLWLPQELPRHVKVLTSCIKDPGREETVLQVFAHRAHELVEMTALTPEERFTIATEVPSISSKRLDPKQMGHLLSNPACANPLYLLVALEELRGFGSFDALNERIDKFPRGDDPVTALFGQVIARLERDFDADSVRDVLCLLAVARRGLSETELLELLEGHTNKTRSISDLFPLLRQIRTYLQYRGELLDFFHRNFYKASHARYLVTDAERGASHGRLAEYFSGKPNFTHSMIEDRKYCPHQRRCDELPWQLAQAELFKDLESLLADYEFIQAKICALGPQPLIADYDMLGAARESQLGLIQGAIRLSSSVLARDPGQLANQLHARMLGFAARRITKLLRDAAESQTQPWLQPAQLCATAPGGKLLLTLDGHAREVTEVAVLADASRVVSASMDGALKVWNIETGEELLSYSKGHSDGFGMDGYTCAAVTPDGSRAVTAARDDRSLIVHDLGSGRVLRTLRGANSAATSVAVTPDGSMAISSFRDGTCKLWSVTTGEVLLTVEPTRVEVTCVALASDGSLAVTGSSDGTLRTWDLPTGYELLAMEGHSSAVACMAVVPDGTRVVSGSADGTLKTWDLNTGDDLITMERHSSAVTCVSVTPDGARILSISADGLLRVCNAFTGELLLTAEGHIGEVTSIVVVADESRAVSSSRDGFFNIWDLETGCTVLNIEGQPDRITCAAVASNGTRGVCGSKDGTITAWDLISGKILWSARWHRGEVTDIAIAEFGSWVTTSSHDGTLKVWDIDTGKVLQTLTSSAGWVTSFAVTPAGTWLVSATWNGVIELWDVGTGKLLSTLKGKATIKAVTPDGARALSVTGCGTFEMWDLTSGRVIRTLRRLTGGVSCVAFTPDGSRAVLGSRDGSLDIWELVTRKKLLTTAKRHAAGVTSIDVTSDGSRALSSSSDGTLKVWDLFTGDELLTVDGHSEIAHAAVTPDGNRAVSTSPDNDLKVWDLSTGEVLLAAEGHTDKVTSVAVTPDGTRAVSTSRDRTVKVWHLAPRKNALSAEAHTDGVTCIVITPDGKRAVSSSKDSTLKVWDLASGEALNTLCGHDAEVTSVAVAANGACAVSASKDKFVKLWNLNTGKLRRSLRGHAADVNSVAVTPNGKVAVSASSDETLIIWSLTTRKMPRTLIGHTSSVDYVTFTPNGKWILSKSISKFGIERNQWVEHGSIIKIWDLAKATELRTLDQHFSLITSLAVTPDGTRAVSASLDRTLKVWDLTSGEVLLSLAGNGEMLASVAVTPDGDRAISASVDGILKTWDLTTGSELRTLDASSDRIMSIIVMADGIRAITISQTIKVWNIQTGRLITTFSAENPIGASAITPDGHSLVVGDTAGRVYSLRLMGFGVAENC